MTRYIFTLFTTGLIFVSLNTFAHGEQCAICAHDGNAAALKCLEGYNRFGGNPSCGYSSKKKLMKKLKHGPYINTVVLQNLLESNVKMVVLDARTGEWDDKTRIPGAKSLYHESTVQKIKQTIQSKDTLIVTYCSSLRCPASKKLYMRLKKMGYKNVLEYPFGMKGWLTAGNDVEVEN